MTTALLTGLVYLFERSISVATGVWALLGFLLALLGFLLALRPLIAGTIVRRLPRAAPPG